MKENKKVWSIGEVEDLLEMIKINYETYLSGDYENKKYAFMLSDGNEFNYLLKPHLLPNLLGLKSKYIFSVHAFNESQAIAIVKKIYNGDITAPDLIKAHEEKIIDLNKLFSSHIKERNIALKKLFECCSDILNYLKKTEFVSRVDRHDFKNLDYVMVSKLGTLENPQYLLVTLSKNIHDDRACALTSAQIYDDKNVFYNRLNDLIIRQPIMMVDGILCTKLSAESSDYNAINNVEHLYIEEKQAKIPTLKEYAKNFDAIISVSKDLELFMQKCEKDYKLNMAFKALAEAVLRNEVILPDDTMPSYYN